MTFRGTPSRKPVTLVKRDASRPSRADLAGYAGTYRSDELGATYIVAANDTAVALRTGTSQPWNALPAYGDTFVGQNMVEFTRDSGKRVNGLLISTGRVRKIRFEKVQ